MSIKQKRLELDKVIKELKMESNGFIFIKRSKIIELVLPFQKDYRCCCILGLLLGNEHSLIEKGYLFEKLEIIMNDVYPLRALHIHSQEIAIAIQNKIKEVKINE